MATNTYVALRTETVAVATGTVTFDLTGISGYTDIVLIANVLPESSARVKLRVDGDTGSNYSYTNFAGNGSSATTGRYVGTEIDLFWFNLPSGWSNYICNFQNYSNTTTFKTILSRGNSTAVETLANVGLWRSTSAIDSITIFASVGTFAVGSTFSLYGIGGVGGDSTVQALGGIVTEDATYYYHTFKGAGTFEPLESLSADILVVAGGGGSMGAGGGGGAGGLLGFASQSLTAQRYPVLVGAGGAQGASVPGVGTPTNGNHSIFGSLTTALGGAYGGGYNDSVYLSAGAGGGSGGGGAFNAAGQFSTGTAGQGNSGNNGYQDPGGGAPRSGGGGGGAGGAATNGGVANTGGTGGIGATNGSTVGGSAGPYNFINAMGAASGTGQLSGGNYYYAGGGGGEGKTTRGAAGLGGGGIGGSGTPSLVPDSGVANTGGGAGSGANAFSSYGGAKGGSGIVIVRYAK
jgi:hypothetical protein